MKFLDLFAGIGGFRLGLEQAGHECVGFCEIDKFARQSYKAIHNTNGEREYHDITTVSNEEWRTLRGTVELICGGFPCQSFSIAGKRRGFLDETRGTLFFEIARAVEQIKPRILFMENVKGLLSHDKGRTFRTILATLDELGYDAEWQVLNSKNFGVPQNRERVFIIGHLRGERGREVFPIRANDKTFNNKYIRLTVQDRHGVAIKVKEATKKGFAIASLGDSINLSVPNSKTRRGRVGKQVAQTLDTSCDQAVIIKNPLKRKTNNGWHFEQNVFDKNGLSRTLKAGGGSGNIPKIIQKPRGFNKGGKHEFAPTISSNSWHENNLLKSGIRIRKLTPRECWRLQGFPRIFKKGELCYKHVKHVGLDLNTTKEEKHAQKNVLINYEGKTLAIYSQEKSLEFVNGVVLNGNVLPHILAEDFVALVVGMLQIQEKETPIGMETNFIKVSATNITNACEKLESISSRLSEFVNAVVKDVKMGKNSLPITRQVLKTNNLDMIYQILYYFVVRAIQPFIPKETETLSILIDWDWAFDKAQAVNSNSQLYKQAGNSVTVPVIYEIARRFE